MRPRRVIVSLELNTDVRVQELGNKEAWLRILGMSPEFPLAQFLDLMEKPKVTVVGKVK